MSSFFNGDRSDLSGTWEENSKGSSVVKQMLESMLLGPAHSPFPEGLPIPSCCSVPSAETPEPAMGSQSPEQPLRELGGHQPLLLPVPLSSDIPMGGQKPGPCLRQDNFTV